MDNYRDLTVSDQMQIKGLTNGEALLQMLRENLLDWVATSIDLDALGTVLCPGDCPDDVVDFTACRPCIQKWLDSPYIGNFCMVSGLFTKRAARRRRNRT